MIFFDHVPSPGRWLKATLDKTGFSQNRASKLVGVNPPQFNRWVNDKEHIPREQLDSLSRLLGLDNQEHILALFLLECHIRTKALDQFLETQAEKNHDLGFLSRIQDLLLQRSEMLALKHGSELSPQNLCTLSRFINDAKRTINLLVSLFQGEKSALLNERNAVAHLQQPMNTFIGSIMDMSANESAVPSIKELGNNIRDNFLAVAQSKGKQITETDFAHQHAIHMLARHGKPEDKEFVLRYADSEDLLTRRMALFGLTISGNEEYKQRLFYQMENNDYLAEAVVIFDGVHYGDISFSEKKFPTRWENLENSIDNTIGYVERDRGLTEKSDLNLMKLVTIFEKNGVNIFTEAQKHKICLLVRRANDRSVRSCVQNKFLQKFRFVLDNESVPTVGNKGDPT